MVSNCYFSPANRAFVGRDVVHVGRLTSPYEQVQALVELYKFLSGHMHYSPWTGPGIQLSPKLNAAQKCVLLTYAKQVEKRDVSMVDVEPEESEEDAASEPGDA